MANIGTRRTRTFAGPVARGLTNGNPTGETLLPGTTETSDSISHGGYKSLLGSGADIGGPWLMTRSAYSYALGKITQGQFVYSDTVITSGPGNQSHPSPPSDASLFPTGATAISRCIPTAPSSSVFTFMSEFAQEGIPSMIGAQTWKKRTEVARNSGGEYLNVQFGWLPLVSEIRKFAFAVKHHSQIVNDLIAGSGHSTRVGYAFPSEQTSLSGATTMLLHKGGNSGVSASVSGSYFRRQTKSTWFKGAFRYLLPTSKTQLGKIQRYAEYADTLLGIKPTPAAVWNATPWTWALDWFSNAGDVMTNITELHQNGLVMEYGYLMTNTKSVDAIATSGSSNGTWGPCSREYTREFKKRIPAHPYGFGVSDGDLSTQQKAIIVALGLSSSGGRG